MINYFLNYETIPRLVESVFNLVGRPNSGEYERAVKDLHEPEAAQKILENRINAIENDSKLSRSEKESLKNDVLDHYMASDIKHLNACADVVDIESENKGNLANTIIKGLIVGAITVGAAFGVANGIQNYRGQLKIIPNTSR